MPVPPPGRRAAFLYASSCVKSLVCMMCPCTASLLELLSAATSGTAIGCGEIGLLGESVQAARASAATAPAVMRYPCVERGMELVSRDVSARPANRRERKGNTPRHRGGRARSRDFLMTWLPRGRGGARAGDNGTGAR